MAKRWKILSPNKQALEELSQKAGISPLVAWLLLNRGINSPEEAQKFLEPRYEHLFLGKELQVFHQGANLLYRALMEGKHIGVYGDYDVDGITATALLVDFLNKIGFQSEYFLPHRIEDGYGLRESGLKELKARGANFLITVDCGISDWDTVKLAKKMGFMVMIIDHHRPSENLPKADLIIDPHLWENPSGMEQLCSAGLVFYLLMTLRKLLREQGFFQKISEPNLRSFLDLVALGTVADIAPALGLNRVLLNFGLKEIEQTSRFGLRLLKKRAGIDDKELKYGNVAFGLAPRLNAAGRIQEADLGLELLLTEDPKRANELADELERRNQLRQRLEERILNEAREQIASLPDFERRRSLVVAGKDWHPGVIGIVAQRLREQFFRPSIVISLHQGLGKGSGRSINGFDLYEGLKNCQKHLIEFGGHALACGLSLKESELKNFQQAFEETVAKTIPEEALEEVLICDAELPLYQITPELISEIEKLAPYGPENPEPVLVARAVTVLDVHLVKEKHLLLLVREREATYQAWLFKSWINDLVPGELIDLAYTIERSLWKGEARTRLIIRDLKKIT